MALNSLTTAEAKKIDRQLKLRKAKAVIGQGVGRNVVRAIATDVPTSNGGDCCVVAYTMITGFSYAAAEKLARKAWNFRKDRGSDAAPFMESVREFVGLIPGRRYGTVKWYGHYGKFRFNGLTNEPVNPFTTLRELLRREPLWTGIVITDHGKTSTHAVAVIDGVPYNSFAKDWDTMLVASCHTGHWDEAR